jgi:hypothetical protein
MPEPGQESALGTPDATGSPGSRKLAKYRQLALTIRQVGPAPTQQVNRHQVNARYIRGPPQVHTRSIRLSPARARTTSSRARRSARSPTAPTARPPATAPCCPPPRRQRARRTAGPEPSPQRSGHLDPDDLVPGRHGHRHHAADGSRAAMPHAVGHQLAAQEQSQVRVDMGLPEHPGHERAGLPHLLGHRRDRHAPAELRRGHQGHRSSPARPGPGWPPGSGPQDGCTPHSAPCVKPPAAPLLPAGRAPPLVTRGRQFPSLQHKSLMV